MKKGLKIFLTIIIIIALLAGAALLIVPRVLIDAFVKESGGKEMTAVKCFENYSVVLEENTAESGNGHITVDIPAKYVPDSEDKLENAQVFGEDDKSNVVVMDKWDWGEDMNLVGTLEKGEYEQYKFDGEALVEEFDDMGLPMPDSAYNTYKCLYLLDNKEYSIVNLNQQIIYAIAAAMRQELMPELGEAYIYETDKIKGFVHVRENTESENGKYMVTMEIFDVNDLNTSTTIMVYTDDINEAYGILNSARAE